MADLLPGPGEVELWYVACEKVTDPRLQDEYRGLLAAEEKQRAQRFVREEHRVQFLAAAALLRTVLSHYTGDDPRGWVFTRNAYGKPSLCGPAGDGLCFNLSHTRGLAACAVTWRRDVGVDAEEVTRSADHLGLARHFFAPAEVAVLEGLAAAEQPGMFFRLWTLKEAWLKARGLGLSVPLRDVAFSLAADDPPVVSFGEKLRENAADWRFAEICLRSRYQIALAVRGAAAAQVMLRVRETLPLRWQSGGSALPASASNRWVV